VIVLNELCGDPSTLELWGAEGLDEEPAIVAKYPWLDE